MSKKKRYRLLKVGWKKKKKADDKYSQKKSTQYEDGLDLFRERDGRMQGKKILFWTLIVNCSLNFA